MPDALDEDIVFRLDAESYYATFIRECVYSGRYDTVDGVLYAALRSLEAEELRRDVMGRRITD